jgi:hypothetical protein
VAGIAERVRAARGATLERVRWTVALGTRFGEAAFERAFTRFRELYHIRPARVLCAPDVLSRYAAVFARTSDDAHRRELRYDRIPLVAAILAPGTIVFEGEVDEERMGDW